MPVGIVPGGKRPIDKGDVFHLEFLQGAQLSPDGKSAVYVVSRYDAADDRDLSALWLINLTTQATRQLTHSKGMDGSPAWSPDGKTIAFTSARAGVPQIFLIPVAGGEARQLTTLKQGASGPVWSPDGTHIAFTAGPLRDAPPDPSKPYRIKRKVYRFDAMGYLDNVVTDLYVIAVAGGEAKRLTADGYLNGSPKWSPDGSRLLYMAMMSPDTPRFLPLLRCITLDRAKHDVVHQWGMVSSAEWLPDGQRIAFIGQPANAMMGSKSDLWVVEAAGEAVAHPVNRTASLAVGVGGGLQGDMPAGGLFAGGVHVVGEAAIVNVQSAGHIQVYRVSLDGPESCELLVGDTTRSVALLDASHARVLYAQTTFNDPAQLAVSDAEGDNEQILTSFNRQFLSQRLQPTVEHVVFNSTDGTQIESWLVLPTVGQAPYPTILYIHGGPWGAWGHTYSFDNQMLAGAGYAVLLVNHRGSSGYGDAFGTAIQGDWGNLDYQDHMAALDAVIARGWADPDRLGVCGISAGGYGSCWMIGHTDRFKAAVPENPVTNLMTIYSVGDIGEVIVRFMGGKPHEVPDNYRRCSPITYAHRCQTPTLLVQGEADFRCPAEQSEQFYAVLKDNGCVVEMLRLPNSPHVGTLVGPPSIRRVQNEALLDWMDRYVLGKITNT